MCNETQKKKVLSCIQPSGIPTLGNYLGALKNWVNMQDEYDCTFAVADLHAITVRQEPAKLRAQIYSMFALFLALGLDYEKSTLFIQSQVPAHSQLAWVLSCYTQFGELSRMTQFKDKSARHADNINAGLFAYPTLMAADILLYQPDFVPVGDDQKQHLEITRDIASRFNHLYGDVFKIPEPLISKNGARIMSLQEPTKKMSKSDDNVNAYISLLDTREDILRKFKRAVTDSEARICVAEGKYGINNLIDIYSVVKGISVEDTVAAFEGVGYGEFKMAVGEAVADTLTPVRERYNEFINDRKKLDELAKIGAEKAYYASRKTMSKVMKKVGFVL